MNYNKTKFYVKKFAGTVPPLTFLHFCSKFIHFVFKVKKGLEQLYKKVEKHLCEEENLLQVVWRNMQDEFIQQYKHYEQLISQCYPNSNIQMDFSIQDLLLYFSDIAQQH